MRKNKNLVVGLICGVACMAAVFFYVQDAQAALDEQRAEVLAKYGGSQVEVYVASRDIVQGSKADGSNAEKKLWAVELLPEGAVTDLSQISGSSAQSTVFKGEVLVQRRFEEQSVQALQVPDGMCAISVPAKPVSAVGGSVSAGTRVNVYSTSATSTDLIAQNIQVLSTSSSSQSSGKSDSNVSWITLATTAAQVTELIAASNAGELYFTLPSEDFAATSSESSGGAASSEGTASGAAQGSSASDGNASKSQNGDSATNAAGSKSKEA